MKILFFGTPQVAVPTLSWLAERHSVVGLVCQPDKPAGRGQHLHAPPVKDFARDKGIPVFQPSGPWEESLVNQLRKTEADLGVAVAYGRILPEAVIHLPTHGTLNIHYSLLPRYRGAAPVQWALINGETETGVSVFWLEKELDAGPIARQDKAVIQADDDAESLQNKLIELGVKILSDVLKDLESGNKIALPQVGEPTHAPVLKKQMGTIDWSRPAADIVNLIRGVRHWPGAVTEVQPHDGAARKLKIHKARVATAGGERSDPGRILAIDEAAGLQVQTGDGVLSVLQVQPEGKNAMSAWAFWQGARLKKGDHFR